jgi:hypothetical protein
MPKDFPYTKDEKTRMKARPCHQLFKKAHGTDPDAFRTPEMNATYYKYYDDIDGQLNMTRWRCILEDTDYW